MYRRWSYVIAAISFALGALLVVVFLSIPAGGGSAVPFLVLSIVTAALFGGVAVMIVRAGSSVVLTFGSEGVEYRSLGYRLVAPWSEVESIGAVILGALSGVGLTIRHDAVAHGGGWIRIASLMDLDSMFGPGYGRVIPLEPFAKPLSGSPLLADLRRRIPELVAGYEKHTTR